MNSNKKSIELKKYTSIVFENEEVKVSKGIEGIYYFEIGEFYTHDVLEAVAILMKNPKLKNSKIWDYKFESKNTNTINVIYWLSGGDIFWKSPELNKDWTEVLTDITNKFEFRVFEAGKKTKLSDIRKYFKKHLNLDTFYEFALSKHII